MSLTSAQVMPQDGNGDPIPVASKLQFQDATGTPKISPQASVDTTGITLTVPSGALVCVLRGDDAIKYGSSATLTGSGTGNGYMVASGDTDVRYPCANVTSIQVAAVASTTTVWFMFEMLSNG